MPTCSNLRDIQRAIKDSYEADNYGSKDDYPDFYYDVNSSLERRETSCLESF